MKYHETHIATLGTAAILLPFTIIIAVIDLIKYPEPPGFLVVGILIAAYLAFLGYVLYQAFHPAVYAMFEDDGLHVISREKGELAFAAWRDVRSFRVPGLYYRRTPVMLLIFRYDATFAGKPLAVYQGYPVPKEAEICEYLLDDVMLRLESGEMTAEEFHGLPLLIAFAETGWNTPLYKKSYSMWRAAKNRSDKREEAGQSLPCVKGGGTAKP